MNLADADGGYKLNLFQGGPEVLGHNVLEVGADYVVAEDVSGVKELRIPIYAIKSVSTTKIPAGK